MLQAKKFKRWKEPILRGTQYALARNVFATVAMGLTTAVGFLTYYFAFPTPAMRHDWLGTPTNGDIYNRELDARRQKMRLELQEQNRFAKRDPLSPTDMETLR